MAGNMESMLLGGDDSSSDDSDDEMLQKVTAGTVVPAAAAAVAATVQPQPPVPAPAPAAMSQSELSNRLKSLYSPANKAAHQQAQAPQSVSASSRPTQPPQQQQQAPSSSSSMQQSQQAEQLPEKSQRRDGLTSASSDFRPLVPNRPSPQQPMQQRPSLSSDPFEPTPLSKMIQRQQAKQAVQPAAPPQPTMRPQEQQAPPHPTMGPQQQQAPTQTTIRSSTGSLGSNTSSNTTAQISNVSASKSELDKSKLERDAKARKERFLMFTRVLMKYLEQKDPAMHTRAKAVIRECAEKNKNKEKGYESVTASMQTRLRSMVGEAYWSRAEAYLNHFMKQKEKMEAKKKQDGLSSQQTSQQTNSTAVSAASKTSSQHQLAIDARQQQQKIEEMRRENEKKRAQYAMEHKQKEAEERHQQLLQKQAQQRREASMMAARKSPNEAAKKKKMDQKRRASPPSGTITGTATAAGALMIPVPTVEAKDLPPREYSDLMELVDHAVDYDWSSAALLLGNDAKADVNLNDEQKKLLYGEKAPLRRQEMMAAQSALPTSELPASMRGWGKRNVLSARGAWARVRLREQREQKSEVSAGNQVPVVAGLKLPTAPQTALESPKLTPEATWCDDEKAEEDMTLAVLSEATEMYLKSILEKALTAARQRENLDGIRLWHLQHGPTKPPLSLRLGCDVRRQVAQVTGNAAKTVQRMEEALERQTNVPAQARDLTNDETLYQASSMSDLALRPKLASAPEQADLNAKRSFEVFGGKESGSAPFGRVPKTPKIILGDIRLSREWADYSHQRMGIATPYLLYE